jgi:hypothetical protein
MKKILLVLFITILPISTSVVQAQSLELMTFKDQWDQNHELDRKTNWLVVSQAMESGDIVKDAFNSLSIKKPGDYGMIYIADISAMPSLISKFFALPKMRDYIFPIGLIREEGELAKMKLPLEAPEKVAVIALNKLNIDGAMYFSDQATFETFLKSEVLK